MHANWMASPTRRFLATDGAANLSATGPEVDVGDVAVRAVLLAVALCLVATFCACGGGSSSWSTPVRSTPTSSWTPDQAASGQAIESGAGILNAIENAERSLTSLECRACTSVWLC